MKVLFERLACWLQSLLPQRVLSAMVYRLMRYETRWVKNSLIRVISRVAGVDWDEARSAELGDYPSFNAFFTRELKPGARVPDPDPAALLCPCDGTISEIGPLRDGAIVQAKGVTYPLEALLADDPSCAALRGGLCCTIYLSPRDYHRVHMPLDGRLERMIHVPGRLFSVAPYTVRRIPGLFARNERVVSIFRTPFGPFAQVLVGAMLVGSMETVWAGQVTPTPRRQVTVNDYAHRDVELARGAEMGRFNMGSTVVLLLPPGAASVAPGLAAGSPVRQGQRLASLTAGGTRTRETNGQRDDQTPL